MGTHSMRDLLVDAIRDLYSAEAQVVEALPPMIERSSDEPLRQTLTEFRQLLHDRRLRLERAASDLDAEVNGVICQGMAGILRDETSMIEAANPGSVRDAAIIGCVQKIQHYQIAGYGTAASHARHLGEEDVADLLQLTLDEEKASDRRLTGIAEHRVNDAAVEG